MNEIIDFSDVNFGVSILLPNNKSYDVEVFTLAEVREMPTDKEKVKAWQMETLKAMVKTSDGEFFKDVKESGVTLHLLNTIAEKIEAYKKK